MLEPAGAVTKEQQYPPVTYTPEASTGSESAMPMSAQVGLSPVATTVPSPLPQDAPVTMAPSGSFEFQGLSAAIAQASQQHEQEQLRQQQHTNTVLTVLENTAPDIVTLQIQLQTQATSFFASLYSPATNWSMIALAMLCVESDTNAVFGLFEQKSDQAKVSYLSQIIARDEKTAANLLMKLYDLTSNLPGEEFSVSVEQVLDNVSMDKSVVKQIAAASFPAKAEYATWSSVISQFFIKHVNEFDVMIYSLPLLEKELSIASVAGSIPTLKELINRINYNPQVGNKTVFPLLMTLIANARMCAELNPEKTTGLTDRLMQFAMRPKGVGIQEIQLRDKVISVLREKGSLSEKVSILLFTGGKINPGISMQPSGTTHDITTKRPKPLPLMTTNYSMDSSAEIPPSTIRRNQQTRGLLLSGLGGGGGVHRSVQSRLTALAPEIGGSWIMLGRELGLAQDELQSIRQSYAASGSTMLGDCASDMLETARKKSRSEGHFMLNLSLQLPRVGLLNLAEKMKRGEI